MKLIPDAYLCSSLLKKLSYLETLMELVNPGLQFLSLAHELSGLGSTRVVRFHASAGRRINEPDGMATGPQDGEVFRCVEPVEGTRTFCPRSWRDLGLLGAAVPTLS